MAKKEKKDVAVKEKEVEETTVHTDDDAKPIKKAAANMDDTLAAIRTKFGDEAIMKLGEKPKVNINAIPTGSIGLDAALGIGGVPRGRIIEIYGPESSGKTTLSLHIIAEAQKTGGICAFIDAEHAMDPEYSKRLGVKIEELLIKSQDFNISTIFGSLIVKVL